MKIIYCNLKNQLLEKDFTDREIKEWEISNKFGYDNMQGSLCIYFADEKNPKTFYAPIHKIKNIEEVLSYLNLNVIKKL